MDNPKLARFLASHVFERDSREFSLCDTLDVKTSVILVVLVFLAGQSEHFFQANLSRWLVVVQCISVTFLIAGGVMAVLELWPRDYGTEGSPSAYQDWVDQLRQYYSSEENADPLTLEKAIEGRAERAKERTEQNIAVNSVKSSYLGAAFMCAVVSLAANVLTLVSRLF